MHPALMIIQYIIKNNAWVDIPARLLQAFYYQCHKKFTRKVMIKTLFNGSKIYLFRNNPVASAFVYTAIPDKVEIDILRKLADKRTIFLDIGANIGAYSLLLRDKIKAVYAFEAHPNTAKLCRENFILNKIDPNCVVSCAVSDDNQPKLFTDLQQGQPTNSRSYSDEGTIRVPAITLDEFVQHQQFDNDTSFVIKIDVEGFEHEVFSGAKQFLSNGKIKGVIFENFSDKQENILSMLHELGYETTLISKHNTFAYPKGAASNAS